MNLLHPKQLQQEMAHAIAEQLRSFRMQEFLSQKLCHDIPFPKVEERLYWLSSQPETACVCTEVYQGSLGDITGTLSSLSSVSIVVKFRSLQQVACQLARLHSAHVVHRDIHDNNVLISLEDVSADNPLDVRVRATLADFETVGPVITSLSYGEPPLQDALSAIGYLNRAPRPDGPLHPPEIRKAGSDWIRDYTTAADVYGFGLMVLVQFGGWQIRENNGYRYWDPNCLTSKYVQQTVGFLPGFGELILRTVAEDPNIRPSINELVRFFASAEAQLSILIS